MMLSNCFILEPNKYYRVRYNYGTEQSPNFKWTLGYVDEYLLHGTKTIDFQMMGNERSFETTRIDCIQPLFAIAETTGSITYLNGDVIQEMKETLDAI